MEKIKLMTIVGTRPEIIRLAAVINKTATGILISYPGPHRPELRLYAQPACSSRTCSCADPEVYMNAVGAVIWARPSATSSAKSYALMAASRSPTPLLILGDTNSCLSAIAAKRLHIPIFHMEAGNRCFDECLPEETNRRIVDHISDVNLCYSEHARRYLNAEGTAKERTYVTGSPMAEVLRARFCTRSKPAMCWQRLGLEKGQAISCSRPIGRRTSTPRKIYLDLFTVPSTSLAEAYDMPILYSCHPRSKKCPRAERNFKLDARVRSA